MIFELIISDNQLCKAEVKPTKKGFAIRSNLMRIPAGNGYLEFDLITFSTLEDGEMFLTSLGFTKGDLEDVW